VDRTRPAAAPAAAWAVAVPVALLVLVAVAQIILARTAALTPWKGGGFGMFSTNDHAGHRMLRITVTARDRSEEIEISPSLERAAARAVMLPRQRELTRLARLVAAREARHGRPADDVRIECWRTAYDPATLEASRRGLCDFTYQVDAVASSGR
jgi:hypothetical protein